MLKLSSGALLAALLVGVGCTPFELPEKFTEPRVLADGGTEDLDAGVFATDFSSCPTFATPPQTSDGGLPSTPFMLKLDLQTSIGLVDVFSSMPVGCALPATVTATSVGGTTPVMPQPVMTWTTDDAGVLSVTELGAVTGLSEGVGTLNVAAMGQTTSRTVWVGGDAVLSIAPMMGYGGFPESLHATATAGLVRGAPLNSVTALFAMRKGVGLEAVERALFMQAVSVEVVEGGSIAMRLTYREFGERLPGRVRDFSATVPVLVEQYSAGRTRLVFTDAVLRGNTGAATFSGHLAFANP